MTALSFSPHLNADLAIQCALLHDVLEDTDTPESILLAEFGPSVTNGVRALTKNKKLPAAERMRDSLRRILEESPEIGMVKLADRICNLTEPPEHWSEDKIAAYLEEAKVIYHSLKGCRNTRILRLPEAEPEPTVRNPRQAVELPWDCSRTSPRGCCASPAGGR